MAIGELQWRFIILFRTMTCSRSDDVYKWDWRDYARPTDSQTKIRHVRLYDADGQLCAPDEMERVTRAVIRFRGTKCEGTTGWSREVELNRIRPEMLVCDDYLHRASRQRIYKLDLFRYWHQLWIRAGEIMRQVPRGHTFTPLHEAHMRKTAKDTSRAATLPGGMNTMIKKKLDKAGIYVTNDDGVGEQDLHQVRRHVYAGHALRGNAESTLDAVHRLVRTCTI